MKTREDFREHLESRLGSTMFGVMRAKEVADAVMLIVEEAGLAVVPRVMTEDIFNDAVDAWHDNGPGLEPKIKAVWTAMLSASKDDPNV